MRRTKKKRRVLPRLIEWIWQAPQNSCSPWMCFLESTIEQGIDVASPISFEGNWKKKRKHKLLLVLYLFIWWSHSLPAPKGMGGASEIALNKQKDKQKEKTEQISMFRNLLFLFAFICFSTKTVTVPVNVVVFEVVFRMEETYGSYQIQNLSGPVQFEIKKQQWLASPFFLFFFTSFDRSRENSINKKKRYRIFICIYSSNRIIHDWNLFVLDFLLILPLE